MPSEMQRSADSESMQGSAEFYDDYYPQHAAHNFQPPDNSAGKITDGSN
jgi:hypothetical protein